MIGKLNRSAFHWLVTFLAVCNAHSAFAQEKSPAPCRVLDPELQGYYSGQCNKDGFADGTGVARGVGEYVGDFKAGRKHGRGVKQWPNGDRYVGEFSDDVKNGYGIYTWGPQSPFAGERYSGQYLADKRHGQGVYEWPNGDRYEGGWEADRVTGYATPMQTLQHYRRLAVLKAVAKPGVKVCREEPLGLAGKRQFAAQVVAVGADGRIQVQGLSESGEKTGELLWDDPMRWLPCY
jgi:hypothetical protein